MGQSEVIRVCLIYVHSLGPASQITDCIYVNAHDGITLGPKNNEKQAQKTNSFLLL